VKSHQWDASHRLRNTDLKFRIFVRYTQFSVNSNQRCANIIFWGHTVLSILSPTTKIVFDSPNVGGKMVVHIVIRGTQNLKSGHIVFVF
jgi:hypothetical protein